MASKEYTCVIKSLRNGAGSGRYAITMLPFEVLHCRFYLSFNFDVKLLFLEMLKFGLLGCDTIAERLDLTNKLTIELFLFIEYKRCSIILSFSELTATAFVVLKMVMVQHTILFLEVETYKNKNRSHMSRNRAY